MVTKIETRLKKLELARGAGGECRCGPLVIAVRYPGDESNDPDPRLCGRCGRRRRMVLLRVEYDSPLNEAE